MYDSKVTNLLASTLEKVYSNNVNNLSLIFKLIFI